MRRITLIIILVLMALAAKAQHKIESPHPDLVVEIKRAVVSNGTAVIDMLITNMGNEEIIEFVLHNERGIYTVAYDDEGNIYGRGRIFLGIPQGKLSDWTFKITFPQEIALKVRVQIENVDPNANQFKLIKIAAYSSGAMSLKAEKPIIIKNLEFTK